MAVPNALHPLDHVVGDWVQAELHDAERSVGTISVYASLLYQFVDWLHQQGDSPGFAEITADAIQTYLLTIGCRLAPNTVQMHRSALRAWCRWLRTKGYLQQEIKLEKV